MNEKNFPYRLRKQFGIKTPFGQDLNIVVDKMILESLGYKHDDDYKIDESGVPHFQRKELRNLAAQQIWDKYIGYPCPNKDGEIFGFDREHLIAHMAMYVARREEREKLILSPAIRIAICISGVREFMDVYKYESFDSEIDAIMTLEKFGDYLLRAFE